MSTKTFRDALVRLAAESGHGTDEFRPLDDSETAKVAAAVEQAFRDAAIDAMSGWWHSDRPCPLPTASHDFGGDGWRHLGAIASDSAVPVWLLVENWYRGLQRLFAFESTAVVVQTLLGNAFEFEYIVCCRQFEWLFAENHHCWVSVAGAGAVERLRRIVCTAPGGGHG